MAKKKKGTKQSTCCGPMACCPVGGCTINGCAKGLIGVGIGLLLAYPVAGPHPVRWALGFFTLSAITQICMSRKCSIK